jgi:tetratricopeptide (TPR) repeat protein
VQICERGSAFWLARHDPEAALPLARFLVRLEPLEEAGYRRLMVVHRALGDLASALRTYHRCATVLEQELGVEPGPALRHTLADVLDEQASREPGAPSSPRRSSPPVRGVTLAGGPTPFVGREGELARLHEAWDQVSARRRFILVTGEPGVGKTRLVSELVTQVRRGHGVVATARCHASAATLPLAPVAEWFRAPHLRHAVRAVAPVWRAEVERLVPSPGGGAGDAPQAWQRVPFYEGLVRVVAATARPVLLTLDDFQWCDRATLSWLGFLLTFPVEVPVLVVATARRDELEAGPLREARGALAAAGHAETLELDELDEGRTSWLAEAVLGRQLDDTERTLLRAATGGNPMSVIEAAREALATAGPVRADSLQATLANRLAALTPDELALTELVAAAGRDVDLDLLIEASDLDEQALVQVVDRLWRARLLVQRGTGYELAHDLIREVAYARVSPPRRWLLHRRVAQAMELLHDEGDAGEAAALAEQYAAGGLPRRALPHLERAVRDALDVFAHDDAIRTSERSLELLAAQPASRARDERELQVVRAMLAPINASRGYASPELETTARRVARLAERLGRTDEHLGALVTLFTCAFVRGRTTDSAEFGRRALELNPAAPGLLAQCHWAVAGAATSLGRIEEADAHFRLACSFAAPDDCLPSGARTDIHARAWWAHARFLLGDVDGAASCSAEAVAAARRTAHPWSLTVALAYAAVTHQLRGDLVALERPLDELDPICSRYRFAYYDRWAMILGGWLRGGAGGCGQTHAGIDGLVAAGSLARLPYWLWLHADVCRRVGDRAAAEVALDSAVSHARAHEDLWWLPEVERARAELAQSR